MVGASLHILPDSPMKIREREMGMTCPSGEVRVIIIEAVAS